MKVILLHNIKGLGQIGDVKNVADGYGQNYLLPRKLVKLATSGAMQEVGSLKKKQAQAVKADRANSRQIAEDLKSVTVEIARKASTSGKLFDGVNKEDIAAKIKESSGINIPADSIKIEHGHIKKIGEYELLVNLAEGTSAVLKVKISASKQ